MNWFKDNSFKKKEGETVNTINSEGNNPCNDSRILKFLKKIIFLTHFLFHFSIFKWKKGLIY